MRAIILAAGFAKRLWPLTRDCAKPLLKVGGETVIDRLLDKVLDIESVTDVTVVVNGRFGGDFTAWAEARSSRLPIRVVVDGAMDDDGKLGAIGDLALALDAIEDAGVTPGPTLVAAGDNLIDFDLAPFATEFEVGTEALLLVREVPEPVPPGRYSEVAVDEAGRIESFREKPTDPRTNRSAIAIYFLPTELPSLVSSYLEEGGNPDAPGHFLAWLCEQRVVRAASVEGPWFDIGGHDSLAAARAAFGDLETTHE